MCVRANVRNYRQRRMVSSEWLKTGRLTNRDKQFDWRPAIFPSSVSTFMFVILTLFFVFYLTYLTSFFLLLLVHPLVFVSRAFESSRGAHKTGTQENISKHRNKEETDRGSLISHTSSKRLHVLCTFVEAHVCLHVCAPGHRQISYVRDMFWIVRRRWSCSLDRLSCDANGASQPVVWTLAHTFHVACAVSS